MQILVQYFIYNLLHNLLNLFFFKYDLVNQFNLLLVNNVLDTSSLIVKGNILTIVSSIPVAKHKKTLVYRSTLYK